MSIPRFILSLRHIFQPGRGFKVVVQLCFHYFPESVLVEEVAEGLEVTVLDEGVRYLIMKRQRERGKRREWKVGTSLPIYDSGNMSRIDLFLLLG
jgi:hypothetical protein